jgi:RNA polymerase sigma factor (sigma-70 family)
MLGRERQTILQHVRPLISPDHAGGVTDAELLRRFLSGHDEASFELLLWRHGPMVLGVCRRVLGDAHDAEDAFQATFLTLARKGGSIGKRASVSGWLYTVAHRIALRAKARAARRSRRERPLGDLAVPEAGCEPADLLAWRELRPLIDAEVERLPDKYRATFVLCYLEGKTNEEAAEQLGCPKGTVQSRLARARERLRARLSRRNVVLAAGPFALMLAEHARSLAQLSPVLVHATTHLALFLAVGKAAAGALSASVAEMVEDLMQEAARSGKARLVAGVLTLLALAGLAAGALAYATSSTGFGPGRSPPVPSAPGNTAPRCHPG